MRPLADYFPEYTGGNDVNKAAKYILWRFTRVNRAKLQIYPHITQATDTSNIRLVFAAVKEYVYVTMRAYLLERFCRMPFVRQALSNDFRAADRHS